MQNNSTDQVREKMEKNKGLQLMQVEMSRQCSDSLQTLISAAEPAALAADSIRRTGSLVLYGIGGSHHVNKIVEPLYRAWGVDAVARVASDVLLAPLPPAPRTALVTSQSGRSGEIVELLARPTGAEERFALTLESESPLAKACKAALVGAGGTEHAFAATRSIVVSLALHGAVLEALGQEQTGLRDILSSAEGLPDIAAADTALAEVDAVIFVGRGVMAGTADSASLSLMELSRVPAIGLEGGQFRHGPYELLRKGIGIVFLRSTGADADGIPSLAQTAIDAGCSVVVFDASGLEPILGASTIRLPQAEGLAAAIAALLSLQTLNIAVARRRIAHDIGIPLRTSKVTI